MSRPTTYENFKDICENAYSIKSYLYTPIYIDTNDNGNVRLAYIDFCSRVLLQFLEFLYECRPTCWLRAEGQCPKLIEPVALRN